MKGRLQEGKPCGFAHLKCVTLPFRFLFLFFTDSSFSF